MLNFFPILSDTVLSSNEMTPPRIIYTNKSPQSTKKKNPISKSVHNR